MLNPWSEAMAAGVAAAAAGAAISAQNSRAIHSRRTIQCANLNTKRTADDICDKSGVCKDEASASLELIRAQ